MNWPARWLGLLGSGGLVLGAWPALALPPPDEVPEEILRTEIITEARSPLNGEPLSAEDYAILQEQLSSLNRDPQVNPELARLIFLLELRRVVRPILPFIR
ncbi:MAG: hypothetical protein HC929_18275 [Leptolyngbyaceae cyanobacterium SM2_5_2]|nr:hypothetical protein [Leptolyngbyaceae cyanobacterium SM2_5_2]